MRSKVLLVFILGLVTGTLIGFLLGRNTDQVTSPNIPVSEPHQSASIEDQPLATPAEDQLLATPPIELKIAGESASQNGMEILDLSIKKSLYNTLGDHLDRREADVLNAQLGRILVWWFDLCRDVLNQDRIQVVYQRLETELVALAVRYTSTKLKKIYTAYAFKPQDTTYSRYYDAEGKEIETRLQNGPVHEYEQITELMDLAGRRHKGVDFKCDVGTNITTPFRARVSRRNWNTRRNGNCLELKYLDSGISAIFLHLDKVMPSTRPGKVLESGTLVAKTGNTGHSTAPHLHYELHSSKGHLLNPFKIHKTIKRRLSGVQLKKFTAHRKKLDQVLSQVSPPEVSLQRSYEPNGSMVKAK